MNSIATKTSIVATKTSIVATKTSIVVTKVEKNYKKNVATHKIMSRQKMEEKGDKPRQVCYDKDFNVATNSSANDKY